MDFLLAGWRSFVYDGLVSPHGWEVYTNMESEKQRRSQDLPAAAGEEGAVREQLSQAAAELSSAADAFERDLVQIYQDIAKTAGGEAEPEGLGKSVQESIDCLRRNKSSIFSTYQRTSAMEDELSARYRDMKRSRDRKWYRLNPPANSTIDLEERQRNHFARGLNAYKLMLICFVGSFLGVVVETLWCLLRHGYIESRAGLVYGPFNLLYGAGAVVLALALYRFRNRGRWLSFLGGMLVGSVVEYVCSWGQEALFGSRSWDYSAMPFNLNGRICLLYSCFWGILGVLWIKDVYPRMAKWILKVPNRSGKIITWCCTIFLALNAVVSLVTVYRWSERIQGVPPESGFWEMIDQRFPDERMERIFANMEFGG